MSNHTFFKVIIFVCDIINKTGWCTYVRFKQYKK